MELIKVGQAAGVRLNALNRTRVTLGRSETCDVVVADSSVSREHAALDRIGDHWRLRDLSSRNGVFLNGIRVHRSTPVAAGDGIQLGDTLLRLAEEHPEVNPQLVTTRSVPSSQPTDLSRREREVLMHLAMGRTDDEIAGALTVSVKTVRSHLDRIRDKTGARKRPDLTRHAMGLGLVESTDSIPRAS